MQYSWSHPHGKYSCSFYGPRVAGLISTCKQKHIICNPYIKVTRSLSVNLYRNISVTAEPVWFSLQNSYSNVLERFIPILGTVTPPSTEKIPKNVFKFPLSGATVYFLSYKGAETFLFKTAVESWGMSLIAPTPHHIKGTLRPLRA